MSSFLKAIVQHSHISQMGEVDSSHGGVLAGQSYHVVLGGAAQGTCAQCDSVVPVIHQL